MKRCPVCKLEKEDSEFHFYKSRGKHYQRCKQCHSNRMLAYFLESKELTDNIREKGCDYCGELDIELIDFHHTNPENKKFCVGRLTGKNARLEEANKCDVVCAGCHRKLERGYRLIKVKDILAQLNTIGLN